MIKTCSVCKKDKQLNLENFHKNYRSNDGFASRCKICYKLKVEEAFQKKLNLQKEKPPKRICNKCDIEKPLNKEYFHQEKSGKFGFRGVCKECKNKAKRLHRTKEGVIEEEYARYKNRVETDEEYRKYQSLKRHNLRQKPEYKKKANEYQKKRHKIKMEDPVYRLMINSRKRLSLAFKYKGFGKDTKTADLLGCSFEELKEHIEKQFVGNMSWENYGFEHGCWHMDHIIPFAIADTEEDVKELSRYTNIQPLWATDNWAKGGNLE